MLHAGMLARRTSAHVRARGAVGRAWFRSHDHACSIKSRVPVQAQHVWPRVATDRVLVGSMGVVTGGLVLTRISATEERGLQHQYRSDEDDSWAGFITSSIHSVQKRVARELEDDNKKVLAGIIATNTAVFGLWRLAPYSRALERVMWRHFACSYDAVAYGKRVHTLLTSAFSHMTLPHFAINMFMLWEFGCPILESRRPNDNAWYNRALAKSKVVDFMRNSLASGSSQLLSLDKFLTLYFSSAVASSALSVLVSRFRGTPGGFTIGASGAVMGIFTVYCQMYPERELLLYGLINLTATQLLELTTVVNVVGSFFQHNFAIDFTGHVGGQAMGQALYMLDTIERRSDN
ncbi:TPA: hypothetical protein N0F65_009016 [Lagenidium giganteum]|uniref:Peptidase S54 rhomboid domain-containing protein n=1 Tax=Lagenidium giganteum TaxID=4803 RepID=A0AAV2YVL7_9STRA|nr:TPA: hypothetical protein N0F65_009016 [Lagenidium giganteum]